MSVPFPKMLSTAPGVGVMSFDSDGHATFTSGTPFTTPAVLPIIPTTTPTLAQVITALVTLGLVVQHD